MANIIGRFAEIAWRNIVKIFWTGTWFSRGTASAGAVVGDSIDAKTGIPEISLYGKKSKPSKTDLANVDLVIFDIQDVGARFYTYINRWRGYGGLR